MFAKQADRVAALRGPRTLHTPRGDALLALHRRCAHRRARASASGAAAEAAAAAAPSPAAAPAPQPGAMQPALPATYKRLVAERCGASFREVARAVDAPLQLPGPGEVLVRIYYAGINGG